MKRFIPITLILCASASAHTFDDLTPAEQAEAIETCKVYPIDSDEFERCLDERVPMLISLREVEMAFLQCRKQGCQLEL